MEAERGFTSRMRMEQQNIEHRLRCRGKQRYTPRGQTFTCACTSKRKRVCVCVSARREQPMDSVVCKLLFSSRLMETRGDVLTLKHRSEDLMRPVETRRRPPVSLQLADTWPTDISGSFSRGKGGLSRCIWAGWRSCRGFLANKQKFIFPWISERMLLL